MPSAGIAYIAIVIAEPGRISQTSQFARMSFGNSDRRTDPQLEALVAAAKEAKRRYGDLARLRSRALGEVRIPLCNAALTSATRKPIGQIMADPETAAWFEEVMREVAARLQRRRASGLPTTSSTSASHSRALARGPG
jgi:2-dehydropantoate 2-reductase